MSTSLSVSTRVLGAAAVALSLGACAKQDRMVTGSIIPTDVRARHPIVLAQTPATLDVFVSGEKALDRRQREDVIEFARNYKESGSGVIQILVPRGTSQAGVPAAVSAIRQALSVGGARGYVDVGSYDVADARLAAPIRLSYKALSARADTRCGEWPDDLGASAAKNGWDNRPYYNFGCSYQQNLAAQVADPRDLVRPRVMDPADSQMRIRAITAVRNGQNPATQWNSSVSPIGTVTP